MRPSLGLQLSDRPVGVESCPPPPPPRRLALVPIPAAQSIPASLPPSPSEAPLASGLELVVGPAGPCQWDLGGRWKGPDP